MEAMRSAWNDERMDEFASRTEANFAELRDEIRDEKTELRDEIKDVETELRRDVEDLRTEMNGRFSEIERRFDILFGALATGIIGLVVTRFIG